MISYGSSNCIQEIFYLFLIFPCRPLIQVKLDVLCQAGLAKADFSKADSTSIKVRYMLA